MQRSIDLITSRQQSGRGNSDYTRSYNGNHSSMLIIQQSFPIRKKIQHQILGKDSQCNRTPQGYPAVLPLSPGFANFLPFRFSHPSILEFFISAELDRVDEM